MTHPLAAIVDCQTGDEAFELLVRSPELVDAVLSHPVAALLEPETLDVIRLLQEAHLMAEALDGHVVVTALEPDGVTTYGT